MERVITLYRGEKCFYAINQDANVVADVCNGNSFSIKGTRYSMFLDIELDQKLQKLFSNGYCVMIRDAE